VPCVIPNENSRVGIRAWVPACVRTANHFWKQQKSRWWLQIAITLLTPSFSGIRSQGIGNIVQSASYICGLHSFLICIRERKPAVAASGNVKNCLLPLWNWTSARSRLVHRLAHSGDVVAFKMGLSSAKNRIPQLWPKPEGICGMIATSCLLPASSFS
jgi:hypothetical protein